MKTLFFLALVEAVKYRDCGTSGIEITGVDGELATKVQLKA